MKRYFFTYVLFVLSFQIFAQNKIDSLEQVLKVHSLTEEKLQTEILLAEAYLDVDLNASRKYLEAISEKIKEKHSSEYHIRYHLAKSILLRIKGEPNLAYIESMMALEHTVNNADSLLYKSKIYNSLGSIADDQSNISKAIEYHLIALRYAEKIDYEKQIATICNGLGRAYIYLSDYETAKLYFKRAIDIKEKRKEFDKHLARGYVNMSNCLDAEGNYTESLQYLDKSILLKKKYKSNDIATDYNNKAYTLLGLKRLNEAETAVNRSIKISDSLGLETDKMYALSTYAEILFAQNRIREAQQNMEQSIEMSKKNNDLYLAKYNLDLMYNIFLKKKDYQKALMYYKERTQVLDTVNSIRSKKEVEKLALEFETEKKNKAIELLNVEKNLNEIKLKKSNQLQIAFLIAAVLILMILFLLRARHKNKVKTDLLLKESMERNFQMKLADSEMQALRAQMNPHFLFNCLNSINSFIIKNEQEQATEYLSKFSKLIRRVLNNSKEPKVTLGNEIETLKLYIELEALRFNNTFEYSIIIQPNVEIDYLEIPPLIIQPYVENSIWHGLMHKKEGIGKLTITIEQEEDHIEVTIEDNGIGRDAAAQLKSKSAEKRKSYGMNITSERLKNSINSTIETSHVEVIDLKDSEDNSIGTKVVIKIGI